jgi:hypothetical protein
VPGGYELHLEPVGDRDGAFIPHRLEARQRDHRLLFGEERLGRAVLAVALAVGALGFLFLEPTGVG